MSKEPKEIPIPPMEDPPLPEPPEPEPVNTPEPSGQ